MGWKNMSDSEEDRHNYTKGKLLQVKYPVYKINRCTQTMLYWSTWTSVYI